MAIVLIAKCLTGADRDRCPWTRRRSSVGDLLLQDSELNLHFATSEWHQLHRPPTPGGGGSFSSPADDVDGQPFSESSGHGYHLHLRSAAVNRSICRGRAAVGLGPHLFFHPLHLAIPISFLSAWTELSLRLPVCVCWTWTQRKAAAAAYVDTFPHFPRRAEI